MCAPPSWSPGRYEGTQEQMGISAGFQRVVSVAEWKAGVFVRKHFTVSTSAGGLITKHVELENLWFKHIASQGSAIRIAFQCSTL